MTRPTGRQELQDAELGLGQDERAAAVRDLPLGRVDDQVAVAHHGGNVGPVGGCRSRARTRAMSSFTLNGLTT